MDAPASITDTSCTISDGGLLWRNYKLKPKKRFTRFSAALKVSLPSRILLAISAHLEIQNSHRAYHKRSDQTHRSRFGPIPHCP